MEHQIDELIDRSRRGDREAFAQVYRQYHGSVARMARFYLNGAAEDAVAETFVRAWESLPRYKDRGTPFSSWLYAIARHVIFDELRTRGRTEARDELPERPVAGPNEDRAALAEAMKRLPEDQRQVIEMKFMLGMDNEEVGAALSRTPGAVNALRWRALRSLKKELGTR